MKGRGHPSRSGAAVAQTAWRLPAVRLLPVLIFAAVAMLGFRIEVVVSTITHASHTRFSLALPPALAQTQPDKAAGQKSDTRAPGNASDSAANPKEAAAPAGADIKGAGSTDMAAAANANPQQSFAATLSKSEVETLQRLAERRDALDQRSRDLDMREGLLKAGETRIDAKIAELHDLEKTIEGLLQKYDQQKQGEIDSLVKIYGAMKPRDAASIFNDLDMPILVAVVQNMKETKVAPIMAQMDREKARALTEELSQRKQITVNGG